MANLTPIIKDSFLQFGGAVLQSRALPDVRDILKPSARQIFYCLYTDKFIDSKPFQKTLKAIGSAFRVYIHGDSSCEGIIMRAGQPFAMRYPLIEVEGSYGTLLESGSWGAPRYTSSRLSSLASYLFADLEKKVIEEWRDNYDDTEQYPMVLPSKGFYNIVNGVMGIGVGASSHIPQYNICELNEALIKLLWNPDIDFEEIYCVPDFATGAMLLNAEEVKESHRYGKGKACILRSVIEFEPKERCLVVKEIPYMVYTNTICEQLEEILNSEDNPGIDSFNDLTGTSVDIKIYLTKTANPDKVLKYLYKNTSLQYHYGVNLTMLENGRFPRLFTWKEALQAHLDHEHEVYTRGYQFDLNKIESRIHVIEGLLRAISIMHEVINLIKTSSNSKEAAKQLTEVYGFTEAQAKAILDIKLARLAHLEISKLQKEQEELIDKSLKIKTILQDETLLKKEIEKGLREVIDKFGDARRTKILNISNEEIIEEKQLSVSITNEGAIFSTNSSTLYSQKRNSVGNKFKLNKGEYIINTLLCSNTDKILIFTDKGKFYHFDAKDLSEGKQYIIEFINISSYEKIKSIALYSKDNEEKNIIFITKKGYVKKSKLKDYNLVRKGNGAIAIDLEKDDEIINVLLTTEGRLGVLSKNGNFIIFSSNEIPTTGRNTKGVIGMKLADKDEVVCCRIVSPLTKEILTITTEGYSKRTSIEEFRITSRATKGLKAQSGGNLKSFVPIIDEKEVLITSNNSQLKVKLEEFHLASRNTVGIKGIKLNENSKIIQIDAF